MSIDSKFEILQTLIQDYKTLSDINKIGKGNEITKLINECEIQLNTYYKKLEDSENNDQVCNITQEEFIELIEEISISEQLIKTTTDFDTIMKIYEEMTNNINKCENFLANKQMTINTI